jgi:methyltransferase
MLHFFNETALFLVILTGLARLVEIFIGEVNARKMLQQGGCEYAAWQRPPIFLVYGLWLISLALLTPKNTNPNELMVGLFLFLQTFRWWSIGHLKQYWTTRIVIIPLTFKINTGPYRFMRHPIYVVLLCEVMALSLTFDQWGAGCFFSGLVLLWLVYRIRTENKAIAEQML